MTHDKDSLPTARFDTGKIPLYHSRHATRRAAVQAVYQWQINRDSLTQIRLQFTTDPFHHSSMQHVDEVYFDRLIEGVIDHYQEIDALFLPYLDRELKTLTPVDLAILRVICYEIKNCQGIPVKALLNEAVELSKEFGANEAYRYVNAILDKVAKMWRAQH